MSKLTADQAWYVYLVRTAQSTLYCGVSTNVLQRFERHKAGKGAKYLRGKAPLSLVFVSPVMSKREAMRCEWRIKRLSKQQKESMVRQGVLPTYVTDG